MRSFEHIHSLPPEKQYTLAGWIGTLRLMSELGEQIGVKVPECFPREYGGTSPPSLTRIAVNLCVELHSSSSSEFVESFTESLNDERAERTRQMFNLIHPDGIGAELWDAFHLYDDLDSLENSDNRNGFGRLIEPLLSEVDFQRPAFMELPTNSFEGHPEIYPGNIGRIRWDIDFYTGKHDPARWDTHPDQSAGLVLENRFAS